ncbi:MAG: XisH family protein [Coleofasciculus sp. A1-SPW-01]|uniref:XisH family protein n=1 Tax=Coleofasciculus TaxID=669368 RepID=UPI00031D77A8|nr:XisH family protein [Coleofasciculus chthonoplastes]
MPAKDIYHDTVKNALIKDDWIITNDPLTIEWGKKDLFIDLGAEKLIAAEKQGQKIAVEIKSFVGLSEVANLEQALGQYILYYDILQRLEPERKLYLAIREETFSDIFEEPIGGILLENKRLNLIVFDSVKEAIVRWIP